MSLVNRLPLTEDSCYDLVHLELTREGDHGIIDDELAHILPWCPNLQSVILSGVPDLTDRTVIRLAHSAPQLRLLDLSDCTKVTDIAVLEAAETLTDLQVVRLNRLPTVTDPSVSALSRSLTALSELEVCDLPLLTAASVRDIWTFSTKLRRLKLAHCAHLTDKAFPFVPTLSPVLSARGSSRAARSSAVNDASAPVVGSRPPTWLENLPPLLFSTAHKLGNLRLLDISYCVRLTDAAILGIVTYAPRIQNLNVSGCMALTDTSAQAIATLGAHLHVLAMSRVERLTDAGVLSIVRKCPRLQSVDVSYIYHLSDLSLMELATLPELRRLSVIGLPHLTDNGLVFLAEHCPLLERLHISHCKHLTLDAIHILLRKLGKLEHLSASGIPALKRVGTDRFSDRPPLGHSPRKHGVYRIFRGGNIRALLAFLDKEQARRREAEQKNIIFVPRADDSADLY